jgi:hypothetical protein
MLMQRDNHARRLADSLWAQLTLLIVVVVILLALAIAAIAIW